MSLIDYTTTPRVAYFSMEIALQADIPTYSGGLGILAGDTMRSAADLELNLLAVSLVSHLGYFKQSLTADGWQQEQSDPWQAARFCKPLDAKITVSIEGRSVWVGGWSYTMTGESGGHLPIILLDTDLDENSAEDRRLTDTLYGDGDSYRLKQEIVLGVGGVRMLQALGFRINHYHMNEGHSALLALELLRRDPYQSSDLRPGESPYNLAQTRKQCSFTTHTPVEAGHDKFNYDLVARTLTDFLDLDLIKRLAGDNSMNMTQLALNLSETINGVTERHAQVSRQLLHDPQVRAITNGVHPATWTSPAFRDLFDRHFPGWKHEPELLVRADCCLQDEDVWQAHSTSRQVLIEKVLEYSNQRLDTNLPILGFARRMTAYKRPELIFSDLQRLKAIAKRYPFQLLVAGKAHPKDEDGKHLIQHITNMAQSLKDNINVIFLSNYEMNLAQAMVAGVDIWLNTPQPPMEASGTSGMKAAFNGIPSLSVLDGWWIEGCIEGITGWAIGDLHLSNSDQDAEALYNKLGETVLPLFYEDRHGWIKVMRGAISKNASFFNSHRMMRRYVTEAYIR